MSQQQSVRQYTGSLPGWVTGVVWVILAVVSFVGSIYLASGIVWCLQHLGVPWSLSTTIGALLYRVLVYSCMVALMLAIGYGVRQYVTARIAGVARLMSWQDVGLGLVGVVAYFLLSAVLLTLASHIPAFNVDQAQDVGLGKVYAVNMMLAFFALVVVTPLFEELIFRGIIYGKLRAAKLPWWASGVIVSVLFGLAHMQWNVGLDVFALSLVACGIREITGSIWGGVVLHMVKNLIAFYFTFIFLKSF